MKNYKKIIILSSVLLIVIVAIVLLMIFDVNLGIFNTLSIAGIKNRSEEVDALVAKQKTEENKYQTTVTSLDSEKTNYDTQKSSYENIDDSTIEIVQDATKNEKYFIEYLWVVLGNYAKANNLSIDIITDSSVTQTATQTATGQGDTVVSTPDGNNMSTNGTATQTGTPNTKPTDAINAESGTMTDGINTNSSTSLPSNAIKIEVKGRYANVADFVFDVENDKELRFKLDNISMTYADNNKIQATFNILSLAVLK